MSLRRQLRAIALLPGTAAVLVPALILIGDGTSVGWALAGVFAALPILVGATLIAAGLALWLWTVRLFATIGEGTLAPWDATRHLVVAGPYCHVRNPVITAVLTVLIGESSLFGSVATLIWCAVFFAVNSVYFALVEEPGLARRVGEQYRSYRDNVPPWIPRRSPWTTAAESQPSLAGQPAVND